MRGHKLQGTMHQARPSTPCEYLLKQVSGHIRSLSLELILYLFIYVYNVCHIVQMTNTMDKCSPPGYIQTKEEDDTSVVDTSITISPLYPTPTQLLLHHFKLAHHVGLFHKIKMHRPGRAPREEVMVSYFFEQQLSWKEAVHSPSSYLTPMSLKRHSEHISH